MADTASTPLRREKVAVIGSGLIGRSWCMLFACAGYEVSLYDVDPEQVARALEDIRVQLDKLQKEGLPRGTLSAQQQRDRISPVDSVKDCVQGAFYIQECVPERLELKQKVWAELDSLVSGDVILASSTSALLPSLISEKLSNRSRFIVVHPTNPPFYAPLVELIPAPWTAEDVVPTTRTLMDVIGQDPIVLNREIDGFVLNRIQYAIMGEGWRLIRDGIVSVADFDRVMSSGLGVRYAFVGPFETAYLNAEGFLSYCERYRDMILRVQRSAGDPEVMDGDTMERVQKEMEQVAGPVSELDSRRQWRDRRLLGLAKLKRDLNDK
ncbi:lambda-crystallin-like [Haliotis cracherodii]|uniref:lambda-crystallin-like n=1 Tax=Haliotis cracherodii TaxID=6455 RepID=UPI0039EB7304